MRSGFVSNFIMTWMQLLGFGVVIVVIGGIQWGVHAAVVSNTVTDRDAVCSAKSYDSTNTNVVMKLDCGGNEDETNGSKFISAYLQKPGPFTCTRYVWAYADCKLQEAEKPAS